MHHAGYDKYMVKWVSYQDKKQVHDVWVSQCRRRFATLDRVSKIINGSSVGWLVLGVFKNFVRYLYEQLQLRNGEGAWAVILLGPHGAKVELRDLLCDPIGLQELLHLMYQFRVQSTYTSKNANIVIITHSHVL